MDKKCVRCNIIKPLCEFGTRSASLDGRNAVCKACIRERSKTKHQNNPELRHQYNKAHRVANREHFVQKSREWYAKNTKRQSEYKKKWRKANPQYQVKRCKVDPCFRIARALRTRLYEVLKGKRKAGSAVDLLGCTIEELKKHLEDHFLPGMSWDNYSVDGWHIDHIVPLDAFDLTNLEQLTSACHYTNLQPLWAADNISKSNKLLS